MNTKDFAKFLEDYAELQRILGAKDFAAQSIELAEIFAAAPKSTVDQALAGADLWITPESAGLGFGAVKSRTHHFKQLASVVKRTSTAAKMKSLKTLLEFLNDHGDMKWSTLISQLNSAINATEDDVIRLYVTRLNADYKDKTRFARTFDALKKDKRIKVKQANEIASKFTDQKISGTKTKAFDWIMKKHEYYVSGIAASRAMAGKSAA